MSNVHAARTIPCAPVVARVAQNAAPPSSWEPAVIDVARETLADSRITLAGSISEQDYRRLLDLRRTLRAAATQLRQAAALGMFPAEFRAGATDALRAAQLLGRANAILREVNGEPTPSELGRIGHRLDRTLRGAKAALDRAYLAAHTGTHP